MGLWMLWKVGCFFLSTVSGKSHLLFYAVQQDFVSHGLGLVCLNSASHFKILGRYEFSFIIILLNVRA